MFHNQFFLLIFEKNLILRSILEYFFAFFGTFRISRFPDSRFQKIWKLSGNCRFWQIATYWVYFPLNFGHWAWFSGQNYWIIIFLEFPDSRFQKIWKWPFLTNCNILAIFSTQFWSLSLIFHSKFLNSHFSGISWFQTPEHLEIAVFNNCNILGKWKFKNSE